MPSGGKIAVLASGGLDSAILLHESLKQFSLVQPIYIRSGHIWEEAELYWLKKFLKTLTPSPSPLPLIGGEGKPPKASLAEGGGEGGHLRGSALEQLVTLSAAVRDLYENHWSLTGKRTPGARSRDETVYLPGKNLLMISKAAVFCALKKIPNLALGPLESNPFPDARVSFFKSMERVCSAALDFKFRIHTPFLKLSKREVMSLGRNLPLELTFSCLSPQKGTVPQTGDSPLLHLLHCGGCNKCAERKRAFRDSGIKDRTQYAR